MFLGFSILQLLEYGIAVIITPVNRLHDYLCCRNSDLGPATRFGRQGYNDFQKEVENGEDDLEEIELDDEKMKDNCADFAEEIEQMRQEMREMKKK